MCEDTMITAVRGGEGGINIPMARGSMEVLAGTVEGTKESSQPASWHVKLVDKASVRGQIYVGVEVSEEKGSPALMLGQDWYHDSCVGKAYYYSSDGDICSGNQIVQKTLETFTTGDVIGIQLSRGVLSFVKNGGTVGDIISLTSGFVRIAVQLHRPGDKLLLLRELVGAAAERDIEKRIVAERQKEEARAELKRKEEEAKRLVAEKIEEKRALEAAKRREEEEEAARVRAIQESQKRHAESEAARLAEEEQRRRAKQEEERRRLEELRRAKLAKEEAARKKAAEEQIRKVARSRGGYYEEEPDPDAPSEAEIQDFLRNCLPLRLAAARQMGMAALPGANAAASMRILLTPQQHHAVKKHLTQLKKEQRTSGSAPDE
eukprot:CAMPEP_0181328198 /NCGR_PEP_ID=MMETSP1101-20121128/22560_1 /TAXON_ID=46948 /ORGANISM="Rhodomonas abbreviata, Strain Caron Lab Isolate" /LENGTH=376 /DNA_ID=CAMNT_0023437015 /DNA_START=63 /DNA_END=1193 /DNA_ORIENTATION=+